MPEIVQFRNGNQIKYLYDARGQKLKVDYFTCLKVIDPIQETQVGNWTYTPNEIDKFSNVFIGNMMYRLSNTVGLPDNPQLIKIENPEGYSSSGGQKWYYRRDHLGSVREVWWQYRNLTMQSTQYYPSGLPWAEGTGVGTQLNKYNGKLWDEMHGWEETDMGWRGQYPAINTFGSIDRKAEKYPWQSPYCVANNNTVKFIDLNGEGAPKNYCNGMRTRDIDWFIEKNNLLFLDKKYKFKDPQKINSDNTSIKVPEKRESILAPQGFVLKEALKTAISTDKHAQLSQTDKMDITPFDKAVSGNPVVQGTLVGVGVSVAAPALVTAGGTALLVTESSAALSIGGGVVEGIVKTVIQAPNDFYIIPIPLSQVTSDATQAFMYFTTPTTKK